MKMKVIIGCPLIFMSGFVAALNLAHLAPNNDYHASWFKVGFCFVMAVVGMLMIKLNKKP